MANVIKTVLTYQLDGSTRDFNIPFEYLARKFVVVTLIGVDRKVLTLNTDYRFATRTTISLTKSWGPADGYTTIELRRVTSTTDRLVDFTDGSILRAYDLNVAQIQTMHVAEEARDLTADTIGVNNDGHLDARGRRIVNLANAVDDRDAVPLGQLKTMSQNSWQARNEALQFRNEAQTFRNQAEGFKTESSTNATNTKKWRDEAEGFKDTSEQYAASAGSYAGNAKDSEDEVRRIAERIKEAGLTGYITRRSFEKGFNVTTWNEVLLWEDDGEYYRWDGTLPKNVPAGSTPETSGGIGLGAWVSVGDASLRTEISPYFHSVNPQVSMQGLNDSLATTNEAVLLDSISTNDVILIPSYYGLSGIGFHSYRADRTNFKTISKTGNATHIFVNKDTSQVTVDAVVGVDPVWVDGRWPQQTTFKNIAITGDRSSFNEAGIYLHQGSCYKIEDCAFSGCKNGVRLGDVWVSEFTNLRSLDGAFQSRRGTSQRWSGCWAAGHADVIGAYHFEDTTYTTLTSCASDNAPRGAYFFQNGSEVTMVSCGAEFPTNTTDTALGTMLALNGNSKVTCIGFKGVPNANQTQPLISVGEGDTLHIINWNSKQDSYPNPLDISVNGDGSTIIIEDSIFSGTATASATFPRVNFRGDYQNSRVIIRSKQNEYIYKCPTGGGSVTAPERKYDVITFTPTFLVSNVVNPALQFSSASATLTKNGNQVTFSWDATVRSVEGLPTKATIKVQMPINYPAGNASYGSQLITGASNFTAGTTYQDGINGYVYLYSDSNSELTPANAVAGTRIRGSITYTSKNTGWV